MMNRVVLVGRLTRNPELRRTDSDVPVVSFSIAVEDRAKDASGNKTVSYIDIKAWNASAENVAKFCRKGSLVGVDGRLQQRTFERADGTKQKIIEVIADSVQFLEPKSKTIPNEDIAFDEEENDSNRNLDSIDTLIDDAPF